MNRYMNHRDPGRIEMIPSGNVTAGTIGTWRFVFTAGPEGIKRGGGIRLLIPNGFSPPIVLPNGWPPKDSELNANDIKEFIPCDLGFVTVRCSVSQRIVGFRTMDPDESFKHSVRGQNGCFFFVLIEQGFLPAEQMMELTYGDPVTGSVGVVTPSISQTVEFSCAVDPEGLRDGPDGGFWPITSPVLKVLGSKLDHWECIASSQPDREGMLKVIAVPRDRYNNPCSEVHTVLSVSVEGQKARNENVHIGRGWNMAVRLENLRISEKPSRITVRDEKNKLCCVSNPVGGPRPDSMNLYWGDLHCHTSPYSGRDLVEELFKHALGVSCLDFCAFTPHEDFPIKLSQGPWEMAQEVSAHYNQPDHFVTFIG